MVHCHHMELNISFKLFNPANQINQITLLLRGSLSSRGGMSQGKLRQCIWNELFNWCNMSIWTCWTCHK